MSEPTAPASRRLGGLALLVALALGLGATSCSGGGDKKEGTDKGGKAKAKAAAEVKPYEPRQDALKGGPLPTLLLAQAWFTKDPTSGKPKPGPARLELWRQGPEGWSASRLEDKDSNVFHKVLVKDNALITIAGEKAMLKRWTFADNAWKSETLWEKSWGGKFNRLRDIEFGDVDGDGKEEWVIATHDSGVIAVYNPPETPGGAPEVVELDQSPDTFVHEIEVGDLEGDGKLEFFATPSDRNTSHASQAGQVVMYRWDGARYGRFVVDGGPTTHAKEILASDIDGDGKSELFGVMEGEINPDKSVKKPVEIRQYFLQPDGSFTSEVVATLPNERQCRFLVAHDFDGDGRKELVAAAFKTGIYLIDSEVDKKTKKATWSLSQFETVSSGFEHATVVLDMDGDGKSELYVAADEQGELRRYVWNETTKAFDKSLIGRLAKDDSILTWNVAGGTL